MALSIIAPIAYISILIGSLATFSHFYRRRKASQQAAALYRDPWFGENQARNIYLTLLHKTPPPPDKLLQTALLFRACEDVRRIWKIREQKQGIQTLVGSASVGDELLTRIGLAEQELEAEIVDTMSEANGYHNGWGQEIFQTATEMMHRQITADKIREGQDALMGVRQEWEEGREQVEGVMKVRRDALMVAKQKEKEDRERQQEEKRRVAERELLEEEEKSKKK